MKAPAMKIWNRKVKDNGKRDHAKNEGNFMFSREEVGESKKGESGGTGTRQEK
jgi:hypothetical protein